MTTTAQTVKDLIENALAYVQDQRVLRHIRDLLVEPYVVDLGWDYGELKQTYPCWILTDKEKDPFGLAYCEFGFGPKKSWGLTQYNCGKKEFGRMGADFCWYTLFMGAYFESQLVKDLDIWRIFKGKTNSTTSPISEEGSWDNTWKKIMELRKQDPAHIYNCGHTIAYRPPER